MPLHQPISVGTLTLPNRLMMPAMRMDLANPDGTATPALIDWYDQMTSAVDMSLCVVEHTYVLPEGKMSPHQLGLSSPYHIEGHSDISRTIHQNDTLAILQLGHGGGSFIPYEIQKDYAHYINWEKQLEHINHLFPAYLYEIGDAFIRAAEFANQAGYDGVEIHAAHHFLLSGLYSPLSNQRDDEFGGSLRNRTALLRYIVSGIRASLDIDFLIFIRFPVCDQDPKGATVQDAIDTLRSLEMKGLDAVDLTTGIHMDPSPAPGAFHHEDVAAICNALAIPVIYSGGIKTQNQANHIIDDGIADIIGVARHMPDFKWS